MKINLFKKKEVSKVVEAITVEPKKEIKSTNKSTKDLIEQIHYEFHNAGDRLLKEAENILQSESLLDKDKVDILKRIGFSSNKEVKKSNEEEVIKNVAIKNAEIIKYYSTTYSNYRFITKEEVIKIADKYNLVLGTVADFIGEVPNKNLKEIEVFLDKEIIKDEDGAYFMGLFDRFTRPITFREYKIYNDNRRIDCHYYRDTTFHIVAPQKDFDMSGKEVLNRVIRNVIPDPIVLYPVKDGFLIITMWGLEAEDELFKDNK